MITPLAHTRLQSIKYNFRNYCLEITMYRYLNIILLCMWHTYLKTSRFITKLLPIGSTVNYFNFKL